MSDTDTFICFECQWTLPKNSNLLIHNESQENKFWGKIKIDGVYSFLKFSKRGIVQNILHAIKYRNRPELATFLGRMFAEELDNEKLSPHGDWLVPIPLHPDRQKERGYNQASFVAGGLAEVWDIEVNENLLVRNQKTMSQTKTHGRFTRFKNLEYAFELKDPQLDLRGKRIIIVDDVLTTGATIEVAGKLLLDAGASELYVVTLALA